MNILLDPYILAVPATDAASQSDDYLERLYQWTTAISRGGEHRFWLSWALYDALLETHCYPTPANMARVRSASPTKSYDVETALRACQDRLFDPPYFDDLLTNATLYYEDERVSVIPEAIAQRLPVEVAQALRKTLAMAALGRFLRTHEVFDDLSFATVPNGFEEKYLRAEVLTIQLEQDEEQQIAEEWMMVFSADELNDLIGIQSFWQDTERALAWAGRQIADEAWISENIAAYTVGRKFNASILNLHADRQPALLGTLFTKTVQYLCGLIPRSEVSKGTPNHPIRKGHKSSEKVTRASDGAEAYRLRIQGDWRLHYWLKLDGSIELANIECGHALHIES